MSQRLYNASAAAAPGGGCGSGQWVVLQQLLHISQCIRLLEAIVLKEIVHLLVNVMTCHSRINQRSRTTSCHNR